jgi:transcriptional regulator with XRE-family HTH domain
MPEEVKPQQVKVPAAFGEIPKMQPSPTTTTEKAKEPTVSDWWADKWNGLVEGLEGFAANVRDETNSNGMAISSFIEDNKSKKPELYSLYNETLDVYKKRGYDDESAKGMAANVAYTQFWQKDNKIENEVLPYIRQKGREDAVKGFGVEINKKVEEDLKNRFFSGAVRGLATSTPAMLTSANTMGMSFFNMAYNNAEEQLANQLAENPELNMSKAEQETYKVAVAGIEAVLEKVGLGNALKGNPMLKRAITGKVLTTLTETGGDIGAEAFEKIVKQEVKGLAGYAKKVASGAISEFETGALQQLSNDLINQYTTDSQGQNVFDPKTAKEIITDVFYAGAQEAIGGGIISGVVAPFQKSAIDMTKDDFDKGIEFAKNVNIEKVSEYLNKQVDSGKISKQEAELTLERMQEFRDSANKLPDDVNRQAQYDLFQLIAEKQRIQKSVAGKDEAIQETAKPKIDDINKKIQQIYDNQKETGVPSPVVEGEAVVEAEPIEGTGKEATPTGGDVQATRSEIEAKRQEEIQRVKNAIAESEQTGALPTVDGELVSNVTIDEINAKYDAQLSESSSGTVGSLINERVVYNDPVSGEQVEGDLFIDGQRVILETEGGRQFDLGNVDDVLSQPIDGGIVSPAEMAIIPQSDGSFVFNKDGDKKVAKGTRMVNNKSGLQAITRDNSGNVKRVTLYSEDGTETYNLTGREAEDAAYYIVRNFVETQEGKDAINQLAEKSEEARRDLTKPVSAKPVQQSTPKTTAEVRAKAPSRPVVEGAGGKVEQDAPQAKNKNNLTKAVSDNAVAQAERLAKRLGLNVKIITHNSRKAFDEAMNQLSKNGASDAAREGGRILFDRNEIHINLEDMTLSDPFHEVFHAAFVNRFAKGSQTQRTKAALEFKNGILKVLRSGSAQDKQLADEVEQFVNDGDYNPSEKAEEFMAQTAGIIATNAQRISKSTMDKLIQWLNNFISKIAPSMKVTTRGEFIDFMNSFSGALFADTDAELSVPPGQPQVDVDITFFPEESSSKNSSKDKFGFIRSYLKEDGKFEKLKGEGYISENHTLDEFYGMPMLLHAPDNAFTGNISREVVDKDGNKSTLLIVRGKGGVFYPLYFHEKGYFWASTETAAKSLAEKMNKAAELGDGTVRMMLVSGAVDKLLSSSVNAQGVIDILESKAFADEMGFTKAELKKSLVLGINNLIDRRNSDIANYKSGKVKSESSLAKSAESQMPKRKLKQSESLEDVLDFVRDFLTQENSIFATRKAFIQSTLDGVAKSVKSDNTTKQFREFLGIETKGSKISSASLTEGFAKLLTEPMLRDVQPNMAYAVLEIKGPVEAVRTEPGKGHHESYPFTVASKDGAKAYIKLLKHPYNWMVNVNDLSKNESFDLTKDPSKYKKILPTTSGMSEVLVLSGESPSVNKAYDELLESSSKQQVQLGMQQAEINYDIDNQLAESSYWQQRERTPMEKYIDLARIKLQDKIYGVIKLQEDIEYSTGKPVGLDQDFRNADVLMHGKAANDLAESMERAEKVAENVKKSGTTLEAFDDLLYALHAQERNRMQRIKNTDIPTSIKDLRDKNNLKPMQVAEMSGIDIETYRDLESGTAEKGITSEELNKILSVYAMSPSQFYTQYTKNNAGSGMTDIEAQTILSTYGLDPVKPDVKDLKPALRDAVNGVYEIIADSRERMLKYGLETADTIVSFESLYKNYVPLQGFEGEDSASEIIDGGRSIEVRWRPKRALGRKSKADSPLLTAIAQNQSTIVRARKNEVAQKLYRLAEANPNDQIWKVIDPSVNKEYKKNPTVNGIKYVAKTISDYLTKPENFSVRIDGEYKFIQFKDPQMAEMLRGANVVKAEFIAKTLGKFNRFLSAYITTYDPEFVLRNFSRDIQVAVINAISEQEIEGGLLKGKNITNKIVKSVPKSIRAIFNMSKKDASPSNEFEQYYKEFIEDGAKTEWFYSKSVDELRKDVDKLISDKKDTRFGSTKVKAAEDFSKNFIERINSSVENGVRLAAYMEARKAGLAREKAAELAKNLTVNFNKSGEWGTVANSLYLFFNASVQGTSRLIRTLKPQFKKNDDGTRSLQVTTAQKIAASMFILGSLMSLLNEALSDDDEDGKSFYSKIPDFEKERNIIIMLPNGKDYFKIPLPYGLNVFYVAGNAMADAGQGLKSVGETVTNIMQAAVGSFSPINFPSSEDFSKWFTKFAAPTALQIPLAIGFNEDYFGRTIYNENFPTDPSPKPDSELGRKGASLQSTLIAKGLNEVTGGSEFRSGLSDINPDSIDFLFGTLSGGAGRTVGRTASVIGSLITGNWDELESNEIPGVRVFYGQPRKFVDLQSYFDKRIEVNQYMEEVKADKITGAEKSRIKEVYSTSKAVDKSLRGLREAEKKAENIEDSDKRDIRMKEIEMKRYAQIAKFQKAYEQYKIDEL